MSPFLSGILDFSLFGIPLVSQYMELIPHVQYKRGCGSWHTKQHLLFSGWGRHLWVLWEHNRAAVYAMAAAGSILPLLQKPQ